MPDWGLLKFEHAYVLGFILLFIICHFVCAMRVKSLYFAHVAHFSQTQAAKSSWLTVLKFTAIVSLFVAMAAPYTARHIDITPKQGYDIALLVDASESMLQRGFDETNYRLDRFTVVKKVVSDFVQKRINDNLGLVVFGSSAFIAAPLTYDKVIFSDIVSRLQIGIAGRSTAIYDALGQGIKLLLKSQAKSKIVILLTDGHDNSSQLDPEAAIGLAKKNGIKVYAIGVGGSREFNQMVLHKIATETGGVMFKANSGGELGAIYEEIDRMEKSEIKSKTFEERTYFYHLPLVISIVSLLLFMLFRNQKGLL